MTSQEFLENFRALLTVNPPKSTIENLFIQALESGLLNYGNEDEDSYRTAKIVYYAILCKMAEQWKSLDPENREESEKLKLMLK